jgi:hypothetical protein
MGGDLTAASEGLGRGCVLTFTVPLLEPPGDDAQLPCRSPPAAELAPPETRPPSPSLPLPPPSPALSSASPPASPAQAGGGANILVAEDDALSQAVMRKLLARLGLRFTLVGDGAAAVDAYTHGAARVHAPQARAQL